MNINEEDFEIQIKKEFLGEASEMLENVETAFMQLEEKPENAQATMDRIFRLAHTIKGSAAVAGFAALSSFAHTFENLLGKLRDKTIAITSEIVDVLLAGNDTLKTYVDVLKADFNGAVNTTDMKRRIEAILQSAEAGAPAATPTPTPAQAAAPAVVAAVTQVPATPAPATTNRSTEPTIDAAKPTVLITDDEPEVLEILIEMVSSMGVNTIKASNGLEALEAVKANKIDAILTDLKMPKMDGLTFINELRKFDKTIPVLFISGFATREDMISFIKLGVVDFLPKPFRSEDVQKALLNALKIKRLSDGIVKLSGLTFRAFVNVTRLADTIDSKSTPPSEKEQVRAKLEAILEEIKVSTHETLKM